MSAIDSLLSKIQLIVKEEQEDLEAELEGFPAVQKLVEYVEEFEATIARLLRRQRKHFVDGIRSWIAKADPTLYTVLLYVYGELVAEDTFEQEMSEAANKFLNSAVPELTAAMMEAIDKDVAFQTLSGRAVRWIDEWSADLAKLMKLNSHKAVQDVLETAIAEGKSIDDVIAALKDLPQFDRVRARRTAITEVLTANSVAQQEAYSQSPAVTGKMWRHSGSYRIKPRDAHVALDGTVVGTEDTFDVNGYRARFPRDPALPASERVNCHCVLSPAVDEQILGLSKEEKEAIRRQVLDQLA